MLTPYCGRPSSGFSNEEECPRTFKCYPLPQKCLRGPHSSAQTCARLLRQDSLQVCASRSDQRRRHKNPLNLLSTHLATSCSYLRTVLACPRQYCITGGEATCSGEGGGRTEARASQCPERKKKAHAGQDACYDTMAVAISSESGL